MESSLCCSFITAWIKGFYDQFVFVFCINIIFTDSEWGIRIHVLCKPTVLTPIAAQTFQSHPLSRLCTRPVSKAQLQWAIPMHLDHIFAPEYATLSLWVIDKCVQCASQSMATEALTRKMLHCPFSMLPTTNETAQAIVHKNIIHLGRPFSGWLPHSAHSCLSNVLRYTFTVVHQKIQSQSWDWTLELGFQNMLCHLVHKVILNIFKEINRWGLECLENGFQEESHFEISYFTLVRSTNLKPSSSCLTINSKFVLVPLNHLKR